MQRPTDRQVTDWLQALAKITVAQNVTDPTALGERIVEMVPLLVERYDSRDFTQTSREFVARECRWFPTYAELSALLDRWPRPAERPLPARQADGLDVMDRAWLAFWHKRQAELFAQQRDFRWGNREGDLANLVSLIRGQSPKAWAVINGRESTPETTDVQREAVQRMVEGFLAESAQHRRAPAESTPLRDVSLHGDRLRQSREARGCNVPVVDDDGEQRV